MVTFINSGRLLRVRCVVVERGVYQKVTKVCVTSSSSPCRKDQFCRFVIVYFIL